MGRIKKQYEEDSELLYLISENTSEAYDAVFEKYSPAINYFSKKYLNMVAGKGIDENDLYQEGMIGLNEAINNYREQKNIKFSTFAFTCIQRKMFSAIKNVNRQKHKILNDSYSLDYKYNEELDFSSNLLCATSSSVEDLLVDREHNDIFRSKLKKELTPFENEVYELKINNFSNEEIASMLSRTYKSIESVLRRIRIKIKNILDEMDWLL